MLLVRSGSAMMLSAVLVLSTSMNAGMAASRVGSTSRVVQKVSGTLDLETRQIRLWDNVFHDEVIATAPGSATEIVFLDETVLRMGENARMVLDKVVFDPDPSTSKMILKLTRGAFSFVSGRLPSSSYLLQTPTATIGVRGTALSVVVAANGVTTVTVSQGTVVVSNLAGVSTTLGAPGLSTTVGPALPGAPPPPPTPPAAPPPMAVTQLANLNASLTPTSVAGGAAGGTGVGAAGGGTTGAAATGGAAGAAGAAAGAGASAIAAGGLGVGMAGGAIAAAAAIGAAIAVGADTSGSGSTSTTSTTSTR